MSHTTEKTDQIIWCGVAEWWGSSLAACTARRWSWDVSVVNPSVQGGGRFLHEALQQNPDANSVVPLCKHQIKTFQTPLKVQ